ncbi:hypothetical protein V1514DRAFT_332562 [Lipomyces japonicus]|uniref:uncharacterized protein n=1 Tax=Lipomyces japonicus TaxID=56871 RepID=UPI0034CEC28C
MSFLKWVSNSSPNVGSDASLSQNKENTQVTGIQLPNNNQNNQDRQSDTACLPKPTPPKDEAELMIPAQNDGSDKFFGMENFGNTCYCNSILQCLYYSKPFREQVLAYPAPSSVIRSSRTTVNGTRSHMFASESASNNAAGATTPKSSTSSSTSSLSSYFSLSSFTTSSSPSSNRNGNETPTKLIKTPTIRLPTDMMKLSRRPLPAQVEPTEKSQARDQQLPSVTTTALSSSVPASSSVVTQSSIFLSAPPRAGNESQTSEAKKRSALQAGPILNLDHTLASSYGLEENLYATVKDLFEAIVENKYRVGVASPSKLIQILKHKNELFRSTMHQDAHEFFNFLLNQIIENVDTYDNANPGLALNKRWVHDLFEGMLTSETKCLTCESVSSREEQFIDLPIDLEEHCSITACLQQFSNAELLCGNNKFHCDACGALQEAERRMKIKQLPRLLTLHLKRFKFTEDLQQNVKLFHRVVFPFQLRLLNNMADGMANPDRLYELYAVVVHVGGGPYHGHYVSIIKTEHAGWVLFDDEIAERVDEQYVTNFFGDQPGMASAYILFYQAVDDKEEDDKEEQHARQSKL